ATVRPSSSQHAVYAGGREPAPADPLQAPYARIGSGNRAHQGRRLVRRVIVDEYHFPTRGTLSRLEMAQQFADVRPLVEGGYHDREAQRGVHATPVRRPRLR